MFYFDLQRFAIIKTMIDNTKISSVQTANSAVSLSAAYALQVSLNNTNSSATFDGTKDVKNIGVKGVLQPEQGGTGVTSLDDLVVGSAKKIAGAQNIVASLNSSVIGNFNGTDTVIVGTRGILPVEKGGTGKTTSPLILTDLNSTSAVSVFQASPRPGITGVLPIENGGTSVTDLSDLASLMGITGNLKTARNLRVSLDNTTEPTPFDGSQDADRIGVTGILPVENGGTGSTILSAVSVGAADRLTEKHKFQVNLSSTLPSTGFDGTYDITDIGVKGVLPVSLGGTGKTKLDALEVGATEQLKIARELQVSLNNTTETTMFDGSSDVKNIKVTGTLDIRHGGTGTDDLNKITVGSANNLSTKTSVVANLSNSVAGSFNGAETSTITVGTQGILPVEKGGTGRSDSPSMIVSLSSELEDTILKEYSRPGIAGILQPSHGGTGKEHLDQVQGIGSALKVVNSSSVASGSIDLVVGTINNDWGKFIVGSTASDKGYLELRTGDNGSEPIYVNQYNGVANSISGSATILDENHNTRFPGTVTAAAFTGTVDVNNISGILPAEKGGTGKDNLDKVTTGAAKKLANSKTFITDLTSSVATAFNGEQNVTIGSIGILPVEKGGTGKAKLSDITVGTATSLQTARVLQVSLNNTTKETKFDGTLNVPDIRVAGILQPEQGGTGKNNLNNVTVGKANTLSTAHKLTVTLDDNASIQSFDGTKDVTIGTTGTLPASKGGTGATILSAVTVGAANKLTPGAQIVTDLSKVGPQNFDGSTSVAAGVQGILPVARGGTNSSISPSIIVNLSPEFTRKPVDLFDSVVSGKKREIIAGATGVLPISLGGTGTSIPSAMAGIGSALRVINNQEDMASGSIDLVYGRIGTDWGMISFEREPKQSGHNIIDDGSLRFKTGADGTEPIMVEQYKDLEGGNKEIQATAFILDGSHNTKFPNTVFATEFSGSIAASHIIPTIQPWQGGTGQGDLMKVTVGTAHSLQAQPILQVNLENYNTTRLIGDRDLKDISINGILQPIHGGTGKNDLELVTVGKANSLAHEPELAVDLSNYDTNTKLISRDVKNIRVHNILQPEHGGTGQDNLDKVTVGSAKKLEYPHSIVTSLSSSLVVTFNGEKDITISTAGVLPINKGGTNMTANPQLQVSLSSDNRVDNFPTSGTNVNIGVSGILPVKHGGTNQDSLEKVHGIGSALKTSISTNDVKDEFLLINSSIASNYFKVIHGAESSTNSYLKFQVGNKGTEEISFEQMLGENPTRTLTLLDANHNSTFPGTVKTVSDFIGQNASLANNATVSGNLSVVKTITGKDITLSGSEKITGNLTVSGSETVSGNVSVVGTYTGKDITLSGNEKVTGNLTVSGSETVSNNLSVVGTYTGKDITLSGSEKMTGNLTVSGSETVGGNISVVGTYTGKDISLSSNLTVSGTYTGKDITLTGSEKINENLSVAKTITTSVISASSIGGSAVHMLSANAQPIGLNESINGGKLITVHDLAYWNGKYDNATNAGGNRSNLAYCNQGAFGTMAIENKIDYVSYAGKSGINLPFAGEVALTSSDINQLSSLKSGFYTTLASVNGSSRQWYSIIENNHKNGNENAWATQIYSPLTAPGNLYWRQHLNTNGWQQPKTILDNSNFSNYFPNYFSNYFPGYFPDYSKSNMSCVIGHTANDTLKPHQYEVKAGWFKVAETPIATAYKDYSITFFVEDVYSIYGNKNGILRAHVKFDVNAVIDDTGTLQWLSASGYTAAELRHFALTFTDNKVVLWTYLPANDWRGRRFTIISQDDWAHETNRDVCWKLFSSVAVNNGKANLNDSEDIIIAEKVHFRLPYAFVGLNVKKADVTKFWFKVATVTFTAINQDHQGLFLVESIFGHRRVGILSIHMRADRTDENDDTTNRIRTDPYFKWVVNEGFKPEDFKLVIESGTVSATSPKTATLWTKIDYGWGTTLFSVLQQGEQSGIEKDVWDLYVNVTKEGDSASVPSGTNITVVSSELTVLPILQGGTGASIAGTAAAHLFPDHLHTGADSVKPDVVMVSKGNSNNWFQKTGWTEISQLRAAMGLGSLTGPLGIEHGGTGASDLPNARAKLFPSNMSKNTAQFVIVTNTGYNDGGRLTFSALRDCIGLGSITGILDIKYGGTGTSLTSDIKAGKDDDGNTIKNTYFSNASLSGSKIVLSTKTSSVFLDVKNACGTASSAQSGLMSAADWSKLNSITGGTPIEKIYIGKTGSTVTVISGTNVSIPAATSSVFGVIKTGKNITNTDGVISLAKTNVTAALDYTPIKSISLADKTTISGESAGIPSADANKFGLVKIGTNISLSSGTISVPQATADILGLVKIGDNITNTKGVISLTKTNVMNALAKSGNTTTFLRGDGTWATVASGTGSVDTSDLMPKSGGTFTGNVSISGNTSIKGNASISGGIFIAGNTSLSSNASIKGNLTVTGGITSSDIIVSAGHKISLAPVSGTVGSSAGVTLNFNKYSYIYGYNIPRNATVNNGVITKTNDKTGLIIRGDDALFIGSGESPNGIVNGNTTTYTKARLALGVSTIIPLSASSSTEVATLITEADVRNAMGTNYYDVLNSANGIVTLPYKNSNSKYDVEVYARSNVGWPENMFLSSDENIKFITEADSGAYLFEMTNKGDLSLPKIGIIRTNHTDFPQGTVPHHMGGLGSNSAPTWYCICNPDPGAKTLYNDNNLTPMEGYSFRSGAIILLHLAKATTTTSFLKLKINNTAALPIYKNGVRVMSTCSPGFYVLMYSNEPGDSLSTLDHYELIVSPNAASSYYCYTSDSASINPKTNDSLVSPMGEYSLIPGTTILWYLPNGNTAPSLTLKINNTAALPIFKNGDRLGSHDTISGYYTLIYCDGTGTTATGASGRHYEIINGPGDWSK